MKEVRYLEPSRITNLWSKISTNPGRPVSRVVIESTSPFPYEIVEYTPGELVLTAVKARANMYCNTIDICDGLIDRVRVEESSRGVVFHIQLNHPAPCKVDMEPGIPARTILTFDRDILRQICKNKVLIIDPGHGGNDPGGRGPVDLLEKHVTMQMSLELKKLLIPLEVRVHLTRQKDETISQRSRFNLAAKIGADLWIGIHTHHDPDAAVAGSAVKYNPGSDGSARLAELVLTELIRKIKRHSRGTHPDPGLRALGKLPAIIVEPVAISNWVEEGLLRNPTFYVKTAQGIINGLSNFWSSRK